eukprot:CAMPEP_0170621664 /NCGR_PEP_ID=MMETSP0224-20130122/28718_1 /TAXON_ID=285029 /ORGANISM="Togula jolla, Strain CCCM 725" /LENGTH=73 /DNA_ID=CAMNT_0010947931 /DNA_START=233 /DNA_END=451 /DNA_ORIENTATION=-
MTYSAKSKWSSRLCPRRGFERVTKLRAAGGARATVLRDVRAEELASLDATRRRPMIAAGIYPSASKSVLERLE